MWTASGRLNGMNRFRFIRRRKWSLRMAASGKAGNVKKDVDKNSEIFRKAGKPEEASRLKRIYEEAAEAFELSFGSANMDSLIGYFYEDTVSFLDYFPEDQTLIFLDEPARLVERAEGVAREFEESMKGRMEKGYIVPKQMSVLRSDKEIFHSLGKRRSLLLSTLDQNGRNHRLQT